MSQAAGALAAAQVLQSVPVALAALNRPIIRSQLMLGTKRKPIPTEVSLGAIDLLAGGLLIAAFAMRKPILDWIQKQSDPDSLTTWVFSPTFGFIPKSLADSTGLPYLGKK